MLVDCGPDLREQMNSAQRDRVDRVIVTHDHADHCHGIDDLRQISHNCHRPVAVHARGQVLANLKERFAYAFQGTSLYPAVIDGHEISGSMAIGDATLSFVDQPHGGITSLGIRIDEPGSSAAYAIDFHVLTTEMADLYEGTDLWISDCLRRNPHPTHAHLDAVLGWARELKVGQLLLTHLDNSMDYATLIGELPDWAAPAYDGQEITL